jgi:hypothetical protein
MALPVQIQVPGRKQETILKGLLALAVSESLKRHSPAVT